MTRLTVRRLLMLVAVAATGLGGCAPEKAAIPSSFTPKPDKPPGVGGAGPGAAKPGGGKAQPGAGAAVD